MVAAAELAADVQKNKSIKTTPATCVAEQSTRADRFIIFTRIIYRQTAGSIFNCVRVPSWLFRSTYPCITCINSTPLLLLLQQQYMPEIYRIELRTHTSADDPCVHWINAQVLRHDRSSDGDQVE
jgi:hypothetical protein